MLDPDLEIRGGEGTQSSRHLDKEGGGGLVSQKTFFQPSVWFKNKGGGGEPPRLLPWIRPWWHIISIEFKNIYGDQSGEFVGGYWA